MASAIVIGFDVANRSWVTSASAISLFESLPPLSGVLYFRGRQAPPKLYRLTFACDRPHQKISAY
ncbi:hypothetical protein QUB00_24500 [Microcoleus sp. F8_C2]